MCALSSVWPPKVSTPWPARYPYPSWPMPGKGMHLPRVQGPYFHQKTHPMRKEIPVNRDQYQKLRDALDQPDPDLYLVSSMLTAHLSRHDIPPILRSTARLITSGLLDVISQSSSPNTRISSSVAVRHKHWGVPPLPKGAL